MARPSCPQSPWVAPREDPGKEEQHVVIAAGTASPQSADSGSRRSGLDNKAGRGDGMSLPDAPHIFLAAALSPPPNSFFEFPGRRRSKAKGQQLPGGRKLPASRPSPHVAGHFLDWRLTAPGCTSGDGEIATSSAVADWVAAARAVILACSRGTAAARGPTTTEPRSTCAALPVVRVKHEQQSVREINC